LPAAAHDRLGANLNLIADFTRNHEFVDVMRQAREFGSFSDPFNTVIPVGPDGWPTGDFGVTLMAAQSGVAGLAGTYRVIFNGRATVTSAASGTVGAATYNEAANETRLDLAFPADGDTMALRFAVTPGSPANAVKNLRVIRPGFDPASHPTFTPTWLAHVSRFRVLRFMDWLSTNHRANAIVGWADRPTLDKKRTDAEGARWETVIELANTARRDPWINIPVRASDDYVRNLATLLRDTLDPSLNVYVEYSNELWNGTFDQFAIHRDLAAAEAASPSSVLRFDGATDPNQWTFRRVGKRTKEIADIFASVWGAGAINNRVRVVLAGQMGNSFVVSEGLDVVDRGMNTRPANVFYALSGAPYIFPSATNDDAADEAPGVTVDQILQGLPRVSRTRRACTNTKPTRASRPGTGSRCWRTRGASIPSAATTSPRSARRTSTRASASTAAGSSMTGTRPASTTFLWFNAGAASYDTPFGAWPLLEDLADAARPKNQCMDDVLGASLPAVTIGFATGTTIPAGAYQDTTSASAPLTNSSAPFGSPGTPSTSSAQRKPGRISCACAQWADRFRSSACSSTAQW
jgi:hypothetical protein